MKIEMGESLGASWLKHVKKCESVQLNWKPTPTVKWMHLDEINAILDELRSDFGEDAVDILGNGGASQLVRQTECDVLGLKISSASEVEVRALEVAIHLKGAGLHYSGFKHGNTNRVNVSDDKVPAKLLGIAMALYSSMGLKKGELCFASPIVGTAIADNITERLALIENLLRRHGFEFKFKLYANEEFHQEIVRRVVALVNDVSDTNELFLRALQLYLACEGRWGNTLPDDDNNSPPPTAGGPQVPPSDRGPQGSVPTGSSQGNVPASPHQGNAPVNDFRRRLYDVVVNGEVYHSQAPMGETAYAAVRAYCEQNPTVGIQELRQAFPRSAHGTIEIILPESEVTCSRHYYRSTITLADGVEACVCNQWCRQGVHENWQRFCDHVQQYGITIVQHM